MTSFAMAIWEITITHQDVTVTVNQVYGVDTDPLQGVNVYLFTGSGAYQGINQPTDANGQVIFNVPEKDYKVRADYLSGQYWSDVFSWQDVGVDINHGTAILHVTHNGQDLFDVPVYLFTESASYLSRLERTDSSGQVQFLLPANSYKFRVDYDGTQYWSDVISIIPHEENNIDLQLELLADLTHDPIPDRFDGVPPIYQPEKIMVASLNSIRGLLVQSVVGQTGEEQKIYYFINDHLGTPQKLLNESANVVWSADYKPYGEADVNVNTFSNEFRLPGQYYDSENGLHFNYHRYYDPSIGRYLRADPIGLDGGTNLYSYVSNDPINSIDPLGLYESQWYLQWVPGQHMWDRSVTAFESGQYGWGTAYLAGMVGEQVLFALTLGQAGAAGVGNQCSIETTSGTNALRTTRHGAERIAGAGSTRGGVLSEAEVLATRGGNVLKQADGGTVRILEVESGKFNVVVKGERGIITTFRHLRQNKIDKLARKFGWY